MFERFTFSVVWFECFLVAVEVGLYDAVQKFARMCGSGAWCYGKD